MGGGQEGLEVRGLFFAGDDADLDAFEAGGFEPAVEIAFGKAGPAVAETALMDTTKMIPAQSPLTARRKRTGLLDAMPLV